MTEYHFFGENPEKQCSHCFTNLADIHINVLELLTQQLKGKISFEKAFSEVVSHEFLHALLYQLEGWDATSWLDDLSNHKLSRKDKPFSVKDWHGGIYGYKEIQG